MTFVPRSMKIALALAGVASLASCISAPTYGTGTSATTQLVEDLGEAVLVINPDQPDIDYEPRPELVKPTSSTAGRTLVPPQKSVASADNPNWIESPEEQRERVYQEIEDNEDNPFYKSPLVGSGSGQLTEKEQLEAFRKARAEANSIDISQRRYLIDPPEEYRTPSSPDALSDLGEPERAKERRRQKLAEGKDPDRCFLFLNCNSGKTDDFLESSKNAGQ
ncbi:hypothetical protein [Martelella radicis]|uniref:Lipoprotein n=1 Tax=Martelella radicis TaxID=1397476 RepID=A0A7W6KMQ7_9HYPH|nr:hypothetical protein [Martelella radicis]MBB4124037.1 hypothetical protein [Martelella radicis]